MAESVDAEVSADIENLPVDADEETKAHLLERLARTLSQNFIDYPWLNDPASHLSKSERVTAQTFVEAVLDLYNSAQLDVLVRASAMANEHVRDMQEGGGAVGGSKCSADDLTLFREHGFYWVRTQNVLRERKV